MQESTRSLACLMNKQRLQPDPEEGKAESAEWAACEDGTLWEMPDWVWSRDTVTWMHMMHSIILPLMAGKHHRLIKWWAVYIRIHGIIHLWDSVSFAVLEGFQVKFWLIFGGVIWLLKCSLIVCVFSPPFSFKLWQSWLNFPLRSGKKKAK